MSRRNTPRLPAGEFTSEVFRLAHDGRGIGSLDGKAVFIEGALPGETVQFRYLFRRKTFDEGYAVSVANPAAGRVAPPCAHATVCGGCSLQHMAADEQLALKQRVLLEQLQHFGNVAPREVLPPLVGDRAGYRRKARLAVRHVAAKGGTLVGFREKRTSYVADINSCAVLLPEVGQQVTALRALLSSLSICDKVPQVEVAAGDSGIALLFRHLAPFADGEQQRVIDWCCERGFECFLQPGNESTLHRVWPAPAPGPHGERLSYRLDDFGLELLFHPQDFTQVNPSVNRQMVRLAIDLLDPQPTDRVLDLFCGLGNFTLPLATRAAHVTGVEGSEAMVARGYENERHNRGRGIALGELRFFAANLDADYTGAGWAREAYDRILLDPPRSGAETVCRNIARHGAARIVYVSCNPATLARDAGILAENGYVLEKAGVMDMFPHTTHVESIALFTKARGQRR